MGKYAGVSNGTTQWDVLTTIVDFCASARKGPTLQEIGDGVGLGQRSSVGYHINQLVDENLLERTQARHRNIRPTEKGKRLVKLMREFE